MFDKLLHELNLSTTQIRIFLGTFIAMFIISSLQLLGVHVPKLIWPVPRHVSVMDSVIPRLELIPNTYHVTKQASILPQAGAASDFDQAAGYALLDFDTGKVLMAKDSDHPFPIASLTKIMTAVVALDLASPNDEFTVSQTAAGEVPTKIGVKPGQKLSLDELLHAMLLTSANDAAEVVREGVDAKYPSPVFIQAMNTKAQFLGLQHTHFMNPQGFDDPNHYSSAEDLAVLAHYALTNYPEIAHMVQKDYQFIPATSTHSQYDLYNWNGLIDVYPNILGLKIGNTSAAGYTTIVLSNRGGKKLLAVVLGAPGILERDLWASELLDIGYQQTLGLDPINVTEDQLRAKYQTWQSWN